jgi:hypothetical protein
VLPVRQHNAARRFVLRVFDMRRDERLLLISNCK